MKQQTLIVVFALFLISVTSAVQAQSYAFKVLVSKGKSEVKSASAWETLKIGTSLKATDEIRVSENSYLGLIHATGKPVEVRDAKTYKVSDLVSKVGVGQSALNKYTDFILSKEEEKKNRLSATGAVVRAAGSTKDIILVNLPDREQASVYGDQVFLEWSSAGMQAPFEVIVTNLMGDDVARIQTQDPQHTLSIVTGSFKSEYEMLVRVVSKNAPGQGSKEYFIKKLRPADRQKIDADIKEIKNNVDETTALGQYYLAGFYEENYLLIDALTAYHQAAVLAPDVDLYKTTYANFLVRMGFKK